MGHYPLLCKYEEAHTVCGYRDTAFFIMVLNVDVLCGMCLQISELSVDMERKQKELQSVQQDKSSLEQQLTSVVRSHTHTQQKHKES